MSGEHWRECTILMRLTDGTIGYVSEFRCSFSVDGGSCVDFVRCPSHFDECAETCPQCGAPSNPWGYFDCDCTYELKGDSPIADLRAHLDSIERAACASTPPLRARGGR